MSFSLGIILESLYFQEGWRKMSSFIQKLSSGFLKLMSFEKLSSTLYSREIIISFFVLEKSSACLFTRIYDQLFLPLRNYYQLFYSQEIIIEHHILTRNDNWMLSFPHIIIQCIPLNPNYHNMSLSDQKPSLFCPDILFVVKKQAFSVLFSQLSIL